MPKLPLPSAVLLILLFTPLSAAELVVRDLLFEVGSPPTAFTYDISDDLGGRSGSDAFASRWRIAVGPDYSLTRAGDTGGPLFGLRLAGETGAFADGGSLRGIGIDLRAGYGFALTDRWTLGLGAQLGARVERMTVEGGSAFDSIAANGLGLVYGLQLGSSYAFADRWVVGVEATWRAERATLSGDRDIGFDSRGFGLALVLGYRFATAPLPLE